MKSKFFSKVMVGCLMMAAMFTACSKDSENLDKDNKPAKAVMSYWYDVNDELLEVADITVSYYYNNNLNTEKMTTQHWERNGSLQTFPGKLGYSVKMTLKEGVELTKDSYRLSYGVNTTGKSMTNLIPTVQNANGGGIGISEGNISLYSYMSVITVKKENLKNAVENINFSLFYNIDSNGKVKAE